MNCESFHKSSYISENENEECHYDSSGKSGLHGSFYTAKSEVCECMVSKEVCLSDEIERNWNLLVSFEIK